MASQQPSTASSNRVLRVGHAPPAASRSTSFDKRTRSDVDSWVEVSSQPSSSSLSSVADEIVVTGLRVQDDPRVRRHRTMRSAMPSNPNATRTTSGGGSSSQEEYEESESEEDRVMTSSGEGPLLQANLLRPGTGAGLTANPLTTSESSGALASDEDDENRTAINYPIRHDASFTPRPNAFTQPPSSVGRHASQPVPGSYFPLSRPRAGSRSSARHSLPAQPERQQSHLPQNVLSPAYNAATEHEEVLRASLSSLLSVAAAARGLAKAEQKRPAQTLAHARSNRVDPMTFRLVPESAMVVSSPPPQLHPIFRPTIRRTSTTSISTTSEQQQAKSKRKAAGGRTSSRERRELKKARHSSSSSTEDLLITPTLLTWVVSAGVVVFLSALSFSAGYSIGKEAGRMEMGAFAADEQLRSCAREAGRSSFGLKRSLARSAIQA